MQILLPFIEIHRNELSEEHIVRWLGFDFDEEFDEVTYQNMFGAKWEGADCTTTVYRRKPDR